LSAEFGVMFPHTLNRATAHTQHTYTRTPTPAGPHHPTIPPQQPQPPRTRKSSLSPSVATTLAPIYAAAQDTSPNPHPSSNTLWSFQPRHPPALRRAASWGCSAASSAPSPSQTARASSRAPGQSLRPVERAHSKPEPRWGNSRVWSIGERWHVGWDGAPPLGAAAAAAAAVAVRGGLWLWRAG